MKTRNLSNITRLLLCTAIAGGSLFATSPAVQPCAPTTNVQDWNFPAEASQLLKEIQSTAASLSRDAAKLESFRGGRLSKQTHATQLMLAKEHINNIGDRLERLQQIRHMTAPWQQQATDSMLPHAMQVVERTQAAILHVNENPNHLWVPSYTDHLTAISDRADRLKESVDLHLELASTNDKLDDLQMKAALLGS